MRNDCTKSIKDFAAEIGVERATVSDIVRINNLPIEKMQHGLAKGLNPQVQKVIRRKLGLNSAARATA